MRQGFVPNMRDEGRENMSPLFLLKFPKNEMYNLQFQRKREAMKVRRLQYTYGRQ